MPEIELVIENKSPVAKDCMVGCRSRGNVVFAEEQVIQPDSSVNFQNLPDIEFEIAISIEEGVSDGQKFTNIDDLKRIKVELFNNEIIINTETEISSQTPTVIDSDTEPDGQSPAQQEPHSTPQQHNQQASYNQQQGQPPAQNQQQGQPASHNHQQGQPPAQNQQPGQPASHNHQQGQPPAQNQQPGQPASHNQQQGHPPAQNQQPSQPASPNHQQGQGSLSADEQYCHSCGDVIKSEASMCPSCGVSTGNSNNSSASEDLPDVRKRELQELARKDKSTLMLVGFLFPSIGYFLIDDLGWAAICFFSSHFLFLGHILSPFHIKGQIENARQELESHDVAW